VIEFLVNLLSGISSTGQLIIRLIAAVGGFVVGYMFSGPVWRAIWRITRRKPIPPALLPWMKFCTGMVLAALLYTLVHLGGGGGWGWGGGGGSGTGGGKGDGKGPGKTSGSGEANPSDDPAKKGDPSTQKAKSSNREILVIELLGGARYPGDGKYYLVAGKEPPLAIAAVDELLKKRGDKIELHIRYSANSVGQRHAAADRLRDAATKHQIPLVETVEGEK
jgi:hypothetical protein